MMSAIVAVLTKYFPAWEPPPGRPGWVKCLCPSHPEEHPSAAVNHEKGTVNCHACGFSGDVVSIVKQMEGVDYAAAFAIAERTAKESNCEVPQRVPRKPRRRVFSLD